MRPVMMFRRENCVKCMKCVEVCPSGALSYQAGEFQYESEKCVRCGACENECYFEVRKFSSHYMTAKNVYDECMRDGHFYMRGGGVTFSGGEPLLHVDFVKTLSQGLREKKVHVAMETAGFVEWENVQRVLDDVDCFLYDVKIVTVDKQRHYLGYSIARSLENLRKLSTCHSHVIVRIPLIPGINDTEEEFGGILGFLKEMKGIQKIHLLPYHTLGSSKYQWLGRDYEMSYLHETSSDRVQACIAMARKRGYHAEVIGVDIREELQGAEK